MARLRATAPPTREEVLARDPLRDFAVSWDGVVVEDVEALRDRLEQSPDEASLQNFLECHPWLLVQHLGGGHGRWCIPHPRLGAEHVPDFVIGERSSDGYEWQAVELESPATRMFTKGGNPTARLTHAIKQIQDWRVWLNQNQNYAARPRAESGLGLSDIRADLPGLIIIGRRRDNAPAVGGLRRQMKVDLRIKLHSYDYLIDVASERLAWAASQGARERRGLGKSLS